MKISTRGRYAIRVMLDLAEHNTGEYIPLMDIAKRQEISEKYLEAIVASLSKNGFVLLAQRKGRRLSAAESPGGVYDWKYFTADRRFPGTGCLSGT